jgi:hypothetical protein
MTHADEVKGLIAQIAYSIRLAVGNGSAAVEEGNAALTAVTRAHETLTNSRVHAFQQLGHIQDATNLLNLLFEQSLAPEISDALVLLNQAREKVTNYANHLSNRISELDRLSHLLEHWISTEINSAGIDFATIADKLTQYYNKL